MSGFILHPDFEPTSHPVGELALCAVRLQADARWPWLILIPRQDGIGEIEHLSAADRGRLMEEQMLAAAAVRAMGEALLRPIAKLNIAALGNVTPQLHLHVVGRRADDAAWPGPVWGVGEAVAYDPVAWERAREAALTALNGSALRTAS